VFGCSDPAPDVIDYKATPNSRPGDRRFGGLAVIHVPISSEQLRHTAHGSS
jgi:hypothetical protein